MTPYNTDISATTERLAARVRDVNAWAQYYLRYTDYTYEQAELLARLRARLTAGGPIIMPYTTNTLDIPRAQRP